MYAILIVFRQEESWIENKLFVLMNLMLVVFVLYQFLTVSSGLMKHINIDENDDKSALIVYEKLYNLIENITMRHSVNMRLWILSFESRKKSRIDKNLAYISQFHKTNNKIMKIIYTADYQLNIPDRRDYATIFLAQTNDNRLENWLNMSLKLPPDSIKIYVNHNDCHLNESMLAEIMSKLWHSHDKIGFIYYISLCMLPSYNNSISGQRSNSVGGDYGQQSHRNNYIINLFYYHPFLRHKSVVEQHQHIWGGMEKKNLINDKGWTDMSSQVFHYFPFLPHKLNFHGYLLTVILFPSTMAYFRSEINMFKKYLSIETLKDPFHSVGAYFGEDVEALLEFQRLLNFSIKLSPTSDMGFYGFKVSNKLKIFLTLLPKGN